MQDSIELLTTPNKDYLLNLYKDGQYAFIDITEEQAKEIEKKLKIKPSLIPF